MADLVTDTHDTPLPEIFPEEDTGEVSRDLHAHLASAGGMPDPDDVLEVLATKVAKKMGNGGGGGNGSPPSGPLWALAAKYPWLAVLAMLVGGGGVGTGAHFGWQATDRSHVVMDEKMAHELADRMTKTESEVRTINVRLDGFGKKIDKVSVGQAKVVTAVNELKAAGVKKKDDEIIDLKREVRRLRRRRER